MTTDTTYRRPVPFEGDPVRCDDQSWYGSGVVVRIDHPRRCSVLVRWSDGIRCWHAPESLRVMSGDAC